MDQTKLTQRSYANEDDFWRIRAFLRETFELHGRRERNWPAARLDYWRSHIMGNIRPEAPLAGQIILWETGAGDLAAVLNTEDPGSAFLQSHPAYRSANLEEEMIATAEKHFAIERDGKHVLAVWADSKDTLRREILKRHGYERGKWTETQWRRDLADPIPTGKPTPGYTIRALGLDSEIPARSWASWRGFHPDDPDEDYEGWAWYLNVQRCPLYRRDLDIVAVTPEGEIASFATFWFDDVTRSAYIEPVATVPEHYRHGLARACIMEGLRRVRALGCTRAFVGGFEPPANALYESTMSPAHDLLEQWIRRW